MPEWNDEGMKVMEEKSTHHLSQENNFKKMMSDLVSIVRSNERLQLAQKNKEKSTKRLQNCIIIQ